MKIVINILDFKNTVKNTILSQFLDVGKNIIFSEVFQKRYK